ATSKSGIFTLSYTQKVSEGTDRQVNDLWKKIRKDHKNSSWKPKPSKLCSWCYFKDICPAFNPELPLEE
ncbi:MAG: hypothetical protein KDD60_12135, partial [Bdellovibrionales bacterium]|nr:hypothetical protein [Bdellovibrionales bacterium]